MTTPQVLTAADRGVRPGDVTVQIRRVLDPGASLCTLGFGVRWTGPDDSDVWNVAVVIDTQCVADIVGAIHARGGRLVEVHASMDRIIAQVRPHSVYPAVYIGPTIQIEGARPTLIQGQGVVVVGGKVTATQQVRYDPTDHKAGECQWSSQTLITDVPSSSLVTNANWRRWKGSHKTGWAAGGWAGEGGWAGDVNATHLTTA